MLSSFASTPFYICVYVCSSRYIGEHAPFGAILGAAHIWHGNGLFPASCQSFENIIRCANICVTSGKEVRHGMFVCAFYKSSISLWDENFNTATFKQVTWVGRFGKF